MNLPAYRATCDRCRRPQTVCVCAFLPSLPTRTRILMLQHTCERDVGIGTARMAHLGLPNSTLRVGVDFTRDRIVAETLAVGPPAYVLFPGPGAIDVHALPPGAPITLVVVDGTWSQARKLVRKNPALAALPRLQFAPQQPSEYHRIRREPAAHCVSTIEALAAVLTVLEPDAGPFDALLTPFREMVERQARFATEVHTSRHVKQMSGAPRLKGPTLADKLAADWPRLVCVQGEANAWPAREPARHEPDVVHFVACRPATGAIYEAVIAPRAPLAPQTPRHVELPAERLLAGESVAAWRASWQEFLRPDDVLVQWGTFHTNLAAAEGLPMPERRVDLRTALAQSVRQGGGTLEACLERMGVPIAPPALDGRGGRRLAALLTLLRAIQSDQ